VCILIFEYEFHLFKSDFIFDICDLVSENLIGKGGSSEVYRGCLPDGKELAVKILKPSDDVLKEFVLEIEIITALNHKNIISLIGFCFEDDNLLLVSDFLSRGSLEQNLHGTQYNLHCCYIHLCCSLTIYEALKQTRAPDTTPTLTRRHKYNFEKRK
jgi:serine/threonine protein kinase